MIALLMAGFGLAMQAPCVTIDQHDAGWALVSLPDGTLAEMPVPDIEGVSFEGARVCPIGLLPRPRLKSPTRPTLSTNVALEDLFR